MKLISFRHKNKERYGLLTEEGIVDATGWIPGCNTLHAVIAAQKLDELKDLDSAHADFDPDKVEILPPISHPQRIFCIGVNYDAHRIETGRKENAYPTVFTRFASTLVGHKQPMIRPKASERFDFEGEMAVVIGRPGRHIAKEVALDYVAGYSCFNDGSVRDWQRHSSQFTPGKNFPSTGGFGPYIVTSEILSDPQYLSLRTLLNGEEMQQGHTSDMIFGAAELIAYLSTFTPLSPGDIIATGTPSGVGDKRNPPVYMKDGDTISVEVDGIGRLENPVVDE